MAEQDLEEREEEQQERVERIQEEREEIAQEERELIEQDAPVAERTTRAAASVAAVSRAVLFLEQQRIGREVLGRLILVDLGTGAVLQRAALNTVRGREFHQVGELIVVVAGSTEGQGAVRLVTLDRESLETVSEGAADIYPDSRLVVDGGQIFAVAADGEAWKLARFDETLTLRQRSDEPVLGVTTILVAGGDVLLQGPDGGLLRLDRVSLELLGELE